MNQQRSGGGQNFFGFEVPANADKVETSLGTLEYFDGVPKANTVEKVYDYLDRARAVEAFLNCIPVMSMYMIREGQREAARTPATRCSFTIPWRTPSRCT
jgi:hypothetical protein